MAVLFESMSAVCICVRQTQGSGCVRGGSKMETSKKKNHKGPMAGGGEVTLRLSPGGDEGRVG